MNLLRVRRIVTRIFGLILLVGAYSCGRAILQNNGQSVTGNAAAWARNHHLNFVVDAAEKIRYGSPPSEQEAKSFPLAPLDSVIETNTPAPLPVFQTSSLPGEGVWTPVRSKGIRPIVWVAANRPSKKFKSVTATYALIDQQELTARLYKGTELPGGNNWVDGNHVLKEDVQNLVFAFNGGFLKNHSKGGYFTEGRELWKLKNGAASLAIDSDGHIHIGTWGKDIPTGGWKGRKWVSVRQNLLPAVSNGIVSPELVSGYWGGGKNGEIYVLRSGICERNDGRLLFIIIGDADATMTATAMRDADCKNAMFLDLNETYPRGYVFTNGLPKKIDTRMWGRDDQYLTKSLREFFTLSTTTD
jgi:hypothetical protein